ncbi:hypothetical protein TRFO_33182 [Tritrichomonas foetus]|uniref:TPR Domain containing protein n=1 Tax=Tritrichomonas foetus TaxID=1144522 RepID=A0A1J4JNB8_9EUKA|nr:hypothetical protein TRFO_33182 [Tritrichomonas foetus]|eukprot:OHT00194.1 hypothetical protein TRFO_33182 [Tritrichomonas foetus]
MDDLSYIMHLGNLAFTKNDYADAIRCYTVAANGNSKILRSDAFLNRAIAHQKLGLIQHAKSDIAQALETPFKNPLIKKCEAQILEDDSNKNRKKSKTNQTQPEKAEKESLADSFPRPHFFLKCSKLQDEKDKNAWQTPVFMQRCRAFKEVGDYVNAMQDAQTGITMAPQNPNFWRFKAEAAFHLRQLDTALESAKLIEQQFSSISILKAKCLWQKKLYKEAIDEANKTLLTDKETGIFLRTSFNIARGRIAEVLYDDPTHPLSIFATRELPLRIEPIIQNRSPYLSHLMNGILNTLNLPHFYYITSDLGIDPLIKGNWYNEYISQIKVPNDQIELQNKQKRIPRNFEPKLLQQALDIGIQIGVDNVSYRDIAISGLAIIEISQLITNWKADHKNFFPSFELVIAIISSWLRFINPAFPVFLRKDLPKSSLDLKLIKNGISQRFDEYIPRFTQKIKDKLNNTFHGIQIDVNHPELLLNYLKTSITVDYEPSKTKIYLMPQQFGTFDLGVIIGEDDEERTVTYNELNTLWLSIIKSANCGKPTKEIFEFMYRFIIADPLLSYSTTVAVILFTALINSLFGLSLENVNLNYYDIRFEAILAADLNEFVAKISQKLKVKYVGNNFISVIDKLPDMQYRTAILLDVPDDDKLIEDVEQ